MLNEHEGDLSTNIQFRSQRCVDLGSRSKTLCPECKDAPGVGPMGAGVMRSALAGLEVSHLRVWITDSTMMISSQVVAPKRRGYSKPPTR